jgi:hypothetical protein
MRNAGDKMVASIVGTFSIAILFIIYFIIFAALLDSPLAENPTTNAILEQGQGVIQSAFNWWLIVDTIAGIALFAGIIYGIIWTIIKIVDNGDSGGCSIAY